MFAITLILRPESLAEVADFFFKPIITRSSADFKPSRIFVQQRDIAETGTCPEFREISKM